MGTKSEKDGKRKEEKARPVVVSTVLERLQSNYNVLEPITIMTINIEDDGKLMACFQDPAEEGNLLPGFEISRGLERKLIQELASNIGKDSEEDFFPDFYASVIDDIQSAV